MNRGIARRTLFESRDDIRFFLSRLARAVRRRSLEVHAFCVLTTHFHLLVRSPDGKLSEAMRQVQLDYVRRFNRARRRDGPLLRGRFTSKPVQSLVYRKTLVRYIDRNPVQAGLSADSGAYPFGSATCYARASGPRWLERSWIEAAVLDAAGRAEYDPAHYSEVFGPASNADLELVELRLGSTGEVDSLDDLLRSTPPEVLEWMRRKARLADGSEPGVPVAHPRCVDAAVRGARERSAELLLRPVRTDGWTEIHAGLLRHLCGASLAEIGVRIGRSTGNAREACRRHLRMLDEHEAYAQQACRLVRIALATQHGAASCSSPESIRGVR